MMQPNIVTRGNPAKLTFDERAVLEDKILPTARKWVAEYPVGSTLHGHGVETLGYWGETS